MQEALKSCHVVIWQKKVVRLNSGINFIYKWTRMTTKGQDFLTQFFASFDSKKSELTLSHTRLVVGHVSGGGAELGVGLDDLVNGLQEVLLCGDLPASSDGEHACLCAHTADLSAWQETHITFCLQNIFQDRQEVLWTSSASHVASRFWD